MKILLTQKVLLTDDFSLEEDKGEFFLVNHQQADQDFILDNIAATMLSYLIGAESIQEAYDHLVAEYNVDPEILKNDLLEYIKSLANDEVIKIVAMPVIEDENLVNERE